MNPTLATPVLATSKPAEVYQNHERLPYDIFRPYSLPPPPPLDEGVNNSLRNFASLAFSCPKWYDVALFFCVSKEDGWVLLNLFDGERPSLSTYWPFRPRHLWSRKKQIHHQFQFSSTNARYLEQHTLSAVVAIFIFVEQIFLICRLCRSRRTEIYSSCSTMTLAVVGKIFPCKAENKNSSAWIARRSGIISICTFDTWTSLVRPLIIYRYPIVCSTNKSILHLRLHGWTSISLRSSGQFWMRVIPSSVCMSHTSRNSPP